MPVAGVRAARLAEGRALAGDALEIDLEPSSPDFDYASSPSPRPRLQTPLSMYVTAARSQVRYRSRRGGRWPSCRRSALHGS